MSENLQIKNQAAAQYRDSSRLNARSALQQRFSTNPRGWFQWYFDHLHLPANSRILELGCGPAGLWRATLDRVNPSWQLTLTDFSTGMIHEARGALSGSPALFHFAAVDAQAIPFARASFDAVIANHMLYHVPDRERAIAEIRRVLRPGGQVFAGTNGAGHMAELHEMANRFLPELAQSPTLVQPRFWPTLFSLENGAEQLSRSFESVSLDYFPDSLEVNEAQPLVNYILSMVNPEEIVLTPERIAQFTSELENEIRARGAIHITKDSGLFIAR